ncbi:MAG: hypothetical protein RL323_649 [Pseudomonadota bacterium]|jgi:hypothetical protein
MTTMLFLKTQTQGAAFCWPRRCAQLLLGAAVLLSGCDMLGIETAVQVNEKKDAEGKAIGSGCRHALRSIEDCYKGNPKAGKAAVFQGWREMDEYMRENKIEGMAPPPTPPAPMVAPGEEVVSKDSAATEKPAANGKNKH